MRCPSCQSETGHAAIRCADCGAPLALPEDPPARPLDRPVDLDRRGSVVAAPPVAPPRPSPPLAAPRPSPPPAAPPRPRPPPPPVTPPRPAPRPPLAPATPEDLVVGAAAERLAVPPPGTVIELRRAPTSRRVLAWLVDGLPFFAAAVLLVLSLGARDPRLIAQLLVVVGLASFTYQALAHWLAGATLGKQLLHLRVVGPDGERPGPGRSALRAGVAVAGVALLGAGPLLALFTRSGRALHDLAAATAVVDATLTGSAGGA
jgi:uncharacterized RDD family membrane protein YckC